MSVEIKPEYAERLRSAYHLWFTTVHEDGTPQPTPVWFVWQGDSFLIYSMPNTQKVKNIRRNPKVSLSYTASENAGTFLVIMGHAAIDQSAPPLDQVPAYVEKYAEGIKALGATPEQMAQEYTTVIRVRPTKVRGS